MHWLQALTYTLICIICVLFFTRQIINSILAYRNSKKLEKSIKELDNVLGETIKDMTKEKFFNEINEIRNKEKENGEQE